MRLPSTSSPMEEKAPAAAVAVRGRGALAEGRLDAVATTVSYACEYNMSCTNSIHKNLHPTNVKTSLYVGA
jgi:hypothetical protein